MGLDEAYADADTIAMHIQDTLHRQMADYGYEIVKALVTNIEPDQRVKDAINDVNTWQRARSPPPPGDAPRHWRSRRPRAKRNHAPAGRGRGRGAQGDRRGTPRVARYHRQHGLDTREAMALVALTQYTDMIRALGEGAKTNTILLPHSPSAVGDLMAQIRDGILVGDLASGPWSKAAQQPGCAAAWRVAPNLPNS